MSQKRNQRQKLKKVNVSSRAQWKKILSDVEKSEVPIELIETITVNLIDGSIVTIDVKELLAAGNSPMILEELLEIKFKALDNIIADIDFYVNINNVVKTVQPITNSLLKNI